MKRTFFKGVALAMVMACFATHASAQGFLKKLQKATEKVESVTSTVEAVTGSGTTEETATDSITPEQFLEKSVNYQVKKVIETDSLGNVIANEDGTTRYKYLLIDKDGKVCEANAAKKHLNSALKSGALILAKVGGGATAGALIGKKAGGSKKSAWIGAGVGAAAGLLASGKDIKAVKEQMKLMKECKKVLKAYQATFTEEGLPIDATADLSNVDGINFAEAEEITKPAAEVKNELLASKEAGLSLEDVDLPDDLGA